MNRVDFVQWPQLFIMSSVAALLILLVSCGPTNSKLKPVTGTVTYRGKALPAAQVRFIPIETTSGVGGFAKTDSAGKFKILYAQGGEGLLPGRYRVTVSQMLMPDGSPGPENVSPIESPAREALPEHYSQEGATRITKDVSANGGVMDLTLD